MRPSIELLRLFAVILITFTHTRNNLESGIMFFFIEKLPTFGTAILSIISGYLYFTVTKEKNNLFQKKIKSLAIPYLLANSIVLILVLIFNYLFGYNSLNRLNYDYTIITEGIFALNSAPINPPTYFIRDMFILFSIIALITQKEFKTLIVVVPVILFGTLFLRPDIIILFMIGVAFAKFKNQINKKELISITIILVAIGSIWFVDLLKFPISFLIFILLIDINFKFYNTGRYSYLLHLYHSPIIIISYPIINIFIRNPILNITTQILIALTLVYFLFLITKKYAFLKILSGGR